MNLQEKMLFAQIEKGFEGQYDDNVGLLQESNRHGIRSSSYYALMLLMRGGKGDYARAEKVLSAVIACQYAKEGHVYSGTYKRGLEEVNPPQFPTVWDDYDPNWREFIAQILSVVLAEYKDCISREAIEKIENSAKLATAYSIQRYNDDIVPMNSNIELMSAGIAEFFGSYFKKQEWIDHSKKVLGHIYDLYKTYGTLAEYNSTTYYAVDFIALATIKKYCKTPEVLAMARELNYGLWKCFGASYSVSMENPSGPYARCYEMNMTEHSSMGALIYKNLGEDYRHLAFENCESFADPLVVLVDVTIPEDLCPLFCVEQPSRQLEYKFVELCERHTQGGRAFLCTATAWIEENLMIGALDGSQNTSGQLHPGTIFWKHKGELYWIRLSRRYPNGQWGQHFTGIFFKGKAEKDCFHMEVQLSGMKDIEVFFEIHGKGITESVFTETSWQLPGLTIQTECYAPALEKRIVGDRIEICYLHRAPEAKTMTFTLKEFTKHD